MSAYLTIEAILKRMKLALPLAMSLEDPNTHQPMTIAYENVHSLLLIDVPNGTIDTQVIASLYFEVGRFHHAAQYAADRAEGRYRAWKAARVDELAAKMPEKLTSTGKPASKQGPTGSEGEAYYRGHKDYDEMSNAGSRFKAIAGFFSELSKALAMKSRHLSDANRVMSGYESIARNEQTAGGPGQKAAEKRLSHYENLAAEAAAIAAASGSVEATRELMSQIAGTAPTPPRLPKSPRSL